MEETTVEHALAEIQAYQSVVRPKPELATALGHTTVIQWLRPKFSGTIIIEGLIASFSGVQGTFVYTDSQLQLPKRLKKQMHHLNCPPIL